MASYGNYAQALFDLCASKTQLEEVFSNYDALSIALSEDENKQWLRIITMLEEDKAHMAINSLPLSSPLFKNFLHVLSSDKQLLNIFKIKKYFFKLADQALQVAYVSVKSALALSFNAKKEVQAKISELIPNKKVIINYKIDPSIISGYQISYLGMELDRSVIGRLERMFFGV